MADVNVNNAPVTEHTTTDSGDVTLSCARKLACLEAAWELDALARILPGHVPNVDECFGAHHIVRGIAGRMLRLSKVLMDGLGDDCQPTERLEHIISLDSGQG